MTEHRISIRTRPQFRPLRALYATATQLGLIGIGVFTGSTAMQWAGFVTLILIVLAMAANEANKTSNLTIAEARKRIDDIEKEASK